MAMRDSGEGDTDAHAREYATEAADELADVGLTAAGDAHVTELLYAEFRGTLGESPEGDVHITRRCAARCGAAHRAAARPEADPRG